MLRYLLLLLPVFSAISSDDHLQREFVQNLCRLNRWKTLAFVLTSDEHWIADIMVSKLIIDVDEEKTAAFDAIDAYVVPAASAALLERGLATKKLDPSKTFVVMLQRFSQLSSWLNNADLSRLDVILTWQRQGALHFRRRRSTSEMQRILSGKFDVGGGLDADGLSIVSDRSFSLHDRLVKVSAFYHPPSTTLCDNGDLCGRDINMIRLIGEILRFRPQFVLPPDGVKWGSDVNGTWTGLIGEVNRVNAEIGVANLFLFSPYLLQVEFSYPYGISCSTFAVPRPKPLAHWRALIRPFDSTLWLLSFGVLFSGGLFTQFTSLFYHYLFGRSAKNDFHRFGNAMFYNLKAIAGIAHSDGSVWPVRCFNSFWVLFCFLLTTFYRTALIATLSIPIAVAPIDSVAGLARSGFHLYGYNTLFLKQTKLSADNHVSQMAARFRVVPKDQSVEDVLRRGDSAFMESNDFLNYKISMSAGRNHVHVMKQCVTTFPVGIAFNPGSPLKHQVSHLLHRFNAAGLLHHWMQSNVRTYDSPNQNPRKGQKKQPFSLHNLQGVFLLLLMGYIVASVAFLGELVVFKFLRRIVTIRPIA